MSVINDRFLSNSQDHSCAEERSGVDRRLKTDQRTNVRFDDSGGDRRSGDGRRSSDEGFEVLE